MNWKNRTILIWFVIFMVGQALFIRNDLYYLKNPGVYMDAQYSGLFFASLVHAGEPIYVKSSIVMFHVGSLLILPMFLMMVKRRVSLTRKRDYIGNHIGKTEFQRILKNYKKYEKRKHWYVTVSDRNRIWVGVDLLTGEDVYMQGEQIFKGTIIIGGQGTGKTSRYFKAMIKQLAFDPKNLTSFLVFTLKSEDSIEFGDYLKALNIPCIPWGMCNILDLALNRMGGHQKSTLQGLLQSAALATGLGSRDPFWLNGSISRLVDHLMALGKDSKPPTLGNAFDRFRNQVESSGDDARMEQSLLETVHSALGATTDAATRVSVLHSPNYGGGLHLGPLYAAANSTFREIKPEGTLTHTTGEQPEMFPHGLYEVPGNVRLPFDWYRLLAPMSLILPPPGNSKPELFCLNFIKMSLLSWISNDISSSNSKLLKTAPADRHRIVLAMDEGHNFLALEPPDGASGISDTRSLAENRQGGQVNILATQSPSRLNKSNKEKLDDFLSVNSNYIFLGVNGEERDKVLKIVGKVKITKIVRSYGRSEDSSERTVSSNGQLNASSTRANVSESIKEETTDFISSELYGQFKEGMSIHATQGKQHRVIYCPLHHKIRLKPLKPSLWTRLFGRFM